MITDNARPIFGPATRRLPSCRSTVDEEGFFVAKSDYHGDRSDRTSGSGHEAPQV